MGTLVVGTNRPYEPSEFRDAEGNLTGFDVDLVNAIARTLDLKVEYRETAFESIIPSVQSKVFALGMSSFFDTKERRCTVYEARPSTCRSYPYAKSCGYWEFLKFERDLQDDEKFVAMTR